MPPSSAYYDSCVFAESLNSSHAEHAACVRMTDVRAIGWRISFCSDLTFAETTITEYVQSFEVLCAANGIEVRRILASEAQVVARRHLGLKKRLRLMGFTSRDFTHLMAATHSGSESLCTVDPDFWDPSNKAQPHAQQVLTAAKKDIEASLPLRIHKPSEFLAV